MTTTVRLEPFGANVEVGDGETVLDAVLRAGLYVHHGCRAGRCGSCAGRLVAGALDHPPPQGFVLTKEQRDHGAVLLCQARGQGGTATVDVAGMQLDADELESGLATWQARIVDVERPAEALRLVTLEALGRRRHWRAGAHVALAVPGHEGAFRSYSLVDPPAQDGRFRLLLRVFPGGRFSGQVDALAHAGATLTVRGPLGRFALRHGHRPALFVAGGTGIGPIHAMLRELVARRSRRLIHVIYGARRAAELALAEELVRTCASLPGSTLVMAAEDDGGAIERGNLERGTVVDALARVPDGALQGAEGYLCGPEAMAERVTARLLERGVEPSLISRDVFVPAPGPADGRSPVERQK